MIPSLVVGTVGGGTALATQKECLQLMGCYGMVRLTKGNDDEWRDKSR